MNSTTITTTTTGANNDTIDDTTTTTTTSSSSVDTSTPPNSIFMITVCAPTNIAVIKYWGKQNVQYNTPINSSFSVTLNMNDHLCAITTIAAIQKQKQQQQQRQCSFQNNSNGGNGDRLWLNGIEDDTASTNQRFRSCIDGVKELATDVIFSNNDNDDDDDDDDPKKKKNKKSSIVVTKDDWKNHMSFHISSYNTFPTAAGLASSAAGYAALVYGLAQLMNAKEQYPYQLSTIARRGSGSACRSLYGGCVMWKMGTTGSSNKNRTEKEDDDDDHDEQDNNNNNHNEPSSSYYNNDDSIAEPIADEHSWPEMRVLIIVTKDTPKDIGSTIGMQRSVSTSSLLQYRATTEIVPIRIKQIMKAWSHHDFHTFGTICMQDSNQFHAICCDTYPPIYYMTDVSKKIVKLITTYNAFQKNNNNKNQNNNNINKDKDNALSDEKKENGNNNNNNNNNKTLQEEEQQEEVRAAYTFDAGPNAVIYVLEKDVIELGALMLHYFPNDTYNNTNNYLRGGFDVTIMHDQMIQYTLDPNLIIACDHALFGKQQQQHTTTTTSNNKQQQQSSSSSSTSSLTTSSDGCSREVQFMYLTRVGSGPKVLMEPTLGSKVAAAAKMAATATAEAVSGDSGGIFDTSTTTTTIITNIDPITGLNSYVPTSTSSKR